MSEIGCFLPSNILPFKNSSSLIGLMSDSKTQKEPSSIHEVDYDPIYKYGILVDNYRKYKPKKWYTRPDDEASLQSHLREIEEYLKQFKYWEDIPYIPLLFSGNMRIEDFEETIHFHALIPSVLVSKVYPNFFHSGICHSYLRRRVFITSYITFVVCFKCLFRVHPIGQPHNNGIYTMKAIEERFQEHLDLKMDLYQNVDERKYKDKSTIFEFRKNFKEAEKEIQKEAEKMNMEIRKKYLNDP